jgi:hypothetical protein
MPTSSGLRDSALTIVPPILPGETVLSHVMRIALLTGSPNLKPLAVRLFGLSSIQPPLIIPSNLTQYVRITEPVFIDVDEVVRKHTLYPILESFLSGPAKAAIESHFWNGGAAKGVYAYLGFTTKSPTSQPRLGMCLKCVVENEALYGVAFWHREHQLPGLNSCGYHASPLVGGCGTCEFSVTSSKVARLPRSVCWCGKPHVELARLSGDLSKEADARISRLLVESLRFPLPEAMRPEDWCTLYSARARELGYRRGQHLATGSFEADFIARFGEELLTHYGALGRLGCRWLSKGVPQVVPFSSCLKHFLVADFLYGSWDAYCEAALRYLAQPPLVALTKIQKKKPAVPAGVSDILKKNPVVPAGVNVITEQHRNTIRQFVLLNPCATRTKVRLGCGPAFYFLGNFDKTWLYDFLPTQRNGSHYGLRTSAQYLLTLDRNLLNKAKTKHALLVHPDTRPRRISRQALLRGITGGKGSVAKKRHLPNLMAFLNTVVETTLQFQIRRAVWIMSHPLSVPDGFSALQFAAKSTKLSQAKILSALAKVELPSSST